MVTAAAVPDWMILERFVFHRDEPGSFPDEEAAPFRASSTTSHGDPFTVAFHITEPPSISRLYLQWRSGGLRPDQGTACTIMTAHRDLVLLRLVCSPVVVSDFPFRHYQMDHFICRASSSPPHLLLKRIPMCTQPIVECVKGVERTEPRTFRVGTLGLLRLGEEEFAMAKLIVRGRIHDKMLAELCVLRSCLR